MNTKNNLKIIFIHNSITWYRTPFFKKLNEIINVKFLFTKVLQRNEDYKGINTDYNELESLDYEIINNKFNIAWKSINYIMKNDYDLVLVTVLDDKYQTFEALMCSIIAKIRRKKVAYFWERWDTSKNLVPMNNRIRSFKTKLLFKILQKFVDTYIVPGRKAREYFINSGIKDEKLFIAPDASYVDFNNSVDIRKENKISQNKKIILYFGRLLEYKGVDILIKAFSILEKNMNNVFLLVCGDGIFKEKCMDIVSELDVENICFTGSIQPELRGAYYSQCNLFVLPNKGNKGQREVWGLSINEAMSVGKPVITTTSNGGGYDLIINNFNGNIVKHDNVQELYDAMYNILSDSEKERKMGENSKSIIQSNFTYEHMAEGFKKAFLYPFNKK